MKWAEYDTMNSIIDDLDPNNHDQMMDYESDCRKVRARKTSKYLQLHHAGNIDLSVVRRHLAEDYSGV